MYTRGFSTFLKIYGQERLIKHYNVPDDLVEFCQQFMQDSDAIFEILTTCGGGTVKQRDSRLRYMKENTMIHDGIDFIKLNRDLKSIYVKDYRRFITDPKTYLYFDTNDQRFDNLTRKFMVMKSLKLDLSNFKYFDKHIREGLEVAIERVGISDGVFIRLILPAMRKKLCKKYPAHTEFINKYAQVKYVGDLLMDKIVDCYWSDPHDNVGALYQSLLELYQSRNQQWWDSYTVSTVEDISIKIHHHSLDERITNDWYDQKYKEGVFPIDLSVHPSITYQSHIERMAIKRHKKITKKYGDVLFNLPETLDKLDKTKWRHLKTPLEMIDEGNDMSHCIGGKRYIKEARQEEGYYFHYDDGTQDGVTVELLSNFNRNVGSDILTYFYVFGEVKKSRNFSVPAKVKYEMATELMTVMKGVDYEDLCMDVYTSLMSTAELQEVNVNIYRYLPTFDRISDRIIIPFVIGFEAQCEGSMYDILKRNVRLQPTDTDIANLYTLEQSRTFRTLTQISTYGRISHPVPLYKKLPPIVSNAFDSTKIRQPFVVLQPYTTPDFSDWVFEV